MAFRIASAQPIYERGKSAKKAVSDAPEQRKPRERDKLHLGRIAELPCTICHVHGIHVAHVRYASAIDDAPLVGKGEKPSDWRTAPLCPSCHLTGPDAQHSTNEAEWWRSHGINPYALCRALYGVSGDTNLMTQLVLRARDLFPARMR